MKLFKEINLKKNVCLLFTFLNGFVHEKHINTI